MINIFFDYIIKNYIEDNTPKGDLARDMKKVAEYFSRNNVSFYAFESIFQECWDEYTNTKLNE
ncbi:MAG: hypothetical protein NC205_03365 [Prevotella sp.]|nr:hypothetical protein [Prevotella sp.]MCM1473383.1 hypothetical protein [Muribaculaceae bacterium]